LSDILDAGLDEISCRGLLLLAESSRDPDLAPFVGSAHLGSSFLVKPLGREAHLAFLTPMEREEAAATGLSLLEPADLGVLELLDRHRVESTEFWSEILSRALAAVGLDSGRLALAGRASLGSVYGALRILESKAWELVEGKELLLRFRKAKTVPQIEEARRSAQGVCAAFRRTAEILARTERRHEELYFDGSPLTVARLRQEISQVLARHGLHEPEGNIVAAGAEAGVPHTQGANDRVLRPGEALVVDLFPKGRVFADCTRTFCVESPPEGVAAAHLSVTEALERAKQEVMAGERGWDLQEKVCSFFEAKGFSTPISSPGTVTGYVHGLGHGVGFEIHEYPSFRRGAGAEGLLSVGDLFTLEPGLYDPGAGYGVRVEDLYLLSEQGLENLTPLPQELDPASW
jgi:Xaa-Pro aminopeptidase